jgi:hypothetical protein
MSIQFCQSFLLEQLLAVHDFSSDDIKVALFGKTVTLDHDTTVYSATGEVTSGNGYTAGGSILTLTAGYQKIFASDLRLGFLSAASHFRKLIDAGGPAKEIAALNHQVFNNYLNAGVTALFLILVILIVASCARVCLRLLSGRHDDYPLREDRGVA